MDGLNHCFQYCNSFNMTVKVTHIEVHDNKLSVLQILKAEQIVELSKPMILRRYSAYKSAELKVCYYRLKFMYPHCLGSLAWIKKSSLSRDHN